MSAMSFAASALSAEVQEESRPATAVPIEGEPFQGAIKMIDADWKIDFATADGTRRVAAANLVKWGQWSESSDGPQVLLTDGGRIVAAELVAIAGDNIEFDSNLLQTVRLGRTNTAGIVFHPPSDPLRAEKLAARVTSDVGETDRVLLTNGDELTGTLGPFSKNILEIKTPVGQLKIDAARIDAVIFNPQRRKAPKPQGVHAWVGLRDGTRVLASTISVNGKKVQLSLPAGAELTLPADAIATLQPIGGQVAYLSDLSAASYRCIPYFDLTWPFRNDRSVGGNLLRAADRLYAKGLGMHSASRLTFNLDQPYRRFEAELAIDEETQGKGSVVGRVFVDSGDGKWQLRYESPTVRGGMPPERVHVELNGAKRVSLLVDFADRGDQQDHADWLDARLVR